MKDFLKSHTLIASISLFLIGFLSFWALEKDKCFEMVLKKEILIKVNCIRINN